METLVIREMTIEPFARTEGCSIVRIRAASPLFNSNHSYCRILSAPPAQAHSAAIGGEASGNLRSCSPETDVMADELDEIYAAMQALYKIHRELYLKSEEVRKEFERLRLRANQLKTERDHRKPNSKPDSNNTEGEP